MTVTINNRTSTVTIARQGTQGPGGPAAPLSDTQPAPLGTASAGVSTEASRSDHVHPMPTAAQVGADPAGAATSAVTTHESALDPHPQYTTAAEAAAAAPVQTVAGRSGNVVLAVVDVANAVDTSDARLSDARTPTAHTHPSTNISDSTTTGRAVLTAADAAAARTVIGVAVTGDGSGNIRGGSNAQSSVTTGSHNLGLGASAQYSLTTGGHNLGLGSGAQYSLTTGGNNIGLGQAAQRSLSTGSNNLGLGSSAQYSLTEGNGNIGFGTNVQFSLTTGSNNLGLGSSAQYSLTTGSNNVGLGVSAQRYLNAGGNLTAAGSGTFLGYDTRASADGNTAETVIGAGARGNGSNTATIGSSSLTLLYTPGQLRALGSYSAAVTDSANVNIDSSGNIKRSTATMLRRVAVPSSASASGTVGDVAYDANYAYFCTATNTWVRCALATW